MALPAREQTPANVLIMLGKVDDRTGFGRAVWHADRVICWCTAEYVSPGMCGIGTETDADHRGQGLATAAAGAFADEAPGGAGSPIGTAGRTICPQ